jgi:hypothetical protein
VQLWQAPDFAALKMPPKNTTSRALISWAAAVKVLDSLVEPLAV